ncbi:putative serine/threonine-protein kinase abkD, partial [Bienertia sinuspersici]
MRYKCGSCDVFTESFNIINFQKKKSYFLRRKLKYCFFYFVCPIQVHLRSAKKILKLCEDNKGFYVKAGQFAASLRQLPKEYTMTLSVLQDQAIPCDFSLIKDVIRKNLCSEVNDIFLSFDEQPFAAASIAQVHRAVLKSQEEVAVKVQYPDLKRLLELDIKIMSFVSEVVAW